ncbi:MAG: hypothetical protein K0B52_02765 [FCB group bacterium]|nr:hypothetical protein [FCB group bacterium]
MNRRIAVIVLTLFVGCLSWAEEDPGTARFIRQQNMLSLPFSYRNSEIHIGSAFSFPGQWMPVLAVSIPFGGVYHLQGALGASRESTFSDARSMFQLAISYSQPFPERPEWFYAVNIMVRHYDASGFENLVTGISGGVGRTWNNIELHAVLDLSLQHYDIKSDEIFPRSSEYIYVLMPALVFRTPYINVSLAGLPGSYAMGVSWILKMGKE